jgi:uncharacterized membrane protein YqjE
MSAIGRAISELWGLFVEDASLTVAIALCVLLAWFIFPVLGIRLEWRGAAMFALLAIALVENVWRSAR